MSENENDEPTPNLQDALNQSAEIYGVEPISEAEFFEQFVEAMTGESSQPDTEEPVIDQGDALNAERPKSESTTSLPEFEGSIDYDFSKERSGQDSADDLQQLLDYVAEENGQEPISVDEISIEEGNQPLDNEKGGKSSRWER